MQVMTISDLMKKGWTKNELLCIAHSKGSPAFKTSGGGKWLFDMEAFEKFINARKRQ